MFDPDLYYDLARQRGKELIAEAEASRFSRRFLRARSTRARLARTRSSATR